jgi:hypothetical protein
MALTGGLLIVIGIAGAGNGRWPILFGISIALFDYCLGVYGVLVFASVSGSPFQGTIMRMSFEMVFRKTDSRTSQSSAHIYA